MFTLKSLDDSEVIAAFLHDVQNACGEGVYCDRALRLDIQKMEERRQAEGFGFYSRTFPALGKALDRALAGIPFAVDLPIKRQVDSVLPELFGKLWNSVLTPSGEVVETPNIACIRGLRQILYLFYKYEVPYPKELEDEVIQKFERTEDEVRLYSDAFLEAAITMDYIYCSTDTLVSTDQEAYRELVADLCTRMDLNRHCQDLGLSSFNCDDKPKGWNLADYYGTHDKILRAAFGRRGLQYTTGLSRRLLKARALLHEALKHVDLDDIMPKHGPGAVAERETSPEKWRFATVSERLLRSYPYDAYFTVGPGQVADTCRSFDYRVQEVPARVCLVPKDSRGPRLISAEPLANQWIQQGQRAVLYKHVESHPLTRYAVYFTNQRANQIGALYGSLRGEYSTLDLKDASDRVSIGLVATLFPYTLFERMWASRSQATILPNGKVIKLHKFSPMGSALCFPIMALTIWSLLASDEGYDGDERELIHVYGDDVIVPTAKAVNAIAILEAVGLAVNKDKSYVQGFFRESCGVDAFKGVDVTPVRFRTVWTTSPSPEAYCSFAAYATELHKRGYYRAYWYVTERLLAVYGTIPEAADVGFRCPSLPVVPTEYAPRARWNSSLQKREFLCLVPKARVLSCNLGYWESLLRYFTENGGGDSNATDDPWCMHTIHWWLKATCTTRIIRRPSDVGRYESQLGQYTERRSIRLERRWR